MKSSLVATVVLLAIAKLVYSQQEEGDLCTIQRDGTSGICKLLSQCPTALAGLQVQRLPQNCGFSGTQPIVCCAESTPATTKKPTTTKAPTKTTTRSGVRKVGDKAKEKCIEYGQYVYEFVDAVALIPDAPKINVSSCGITSTALIVGGELTTPKEFPHMALIGYGPEADKLWRCGGTLVSEQFVMTAGHCIFSQALGEAQWVRLGDLNIKLTTDNAKPQDFSVVERLRHPEYKPPSQYNDIALLKLDRKAEMNGYVRPACLHTTEATGTRAIATGWGNVEFGGDSSDHLLKVVLDLFSHETCNRTYQSNISTRKLSKGILNESQLCAGGTTAEKDTCQGDSGGPLQVYHKTVYCMYSIIGVTSFGKACGQVNVPGVYSRVSFYMPWLEKTLWP